MDSIRIYQLTTPFSKDEIAQRMLNQSYTSDKSLGFHLEQSNTNKIIGEYYYKQIISQTLTDPMGNEFENNIIKFDKYQFEFYERASILVVINPPSSMAFFINKIGTLLDNEVIISPVKFNLIKFTDFCKSYFDSLLINSIEINGIFFSSKTIGYARITGNEDVTQYLELYSKNKTPVEVKKLRIKVISFSYEFIISLSALGTIWIPNKRKSYITEKLVEIIIDYLE
jgi:hypothetical protein